MKINLKKGRRCTLLAIQKKSSKYKYKVYGTSLNSLILNKVLKTPNYIKIDVDGAEYLVLMSANKFLKKKISKAFLLN